MHVVILVQLVLFLDHLVNMLRIGLLNLYQIVHQLDSEGNAIPPLKVDHVSVDFSLNILHLILIINLLRSCLPDSVHRMAPLIIQSSLKSALTVRDHRVHVLLYVLVIVVIRYLLEDLLGLWVETVYKGLLYVFVLEVILVALIVKLYELGTPQLLKLLFKTVDFVILYAYVLHKVQLRKEGRLHHDSRLSINVNFLSMAKAEDHLVVVIIP